MINSMFNINGEVIAKSAIFTEINSLRNSIVNLTSRFLSLESIHRATVEELDSVCIMQYCCLFLCIYLYTIILAILASNRNK